LELIVTLFRDLLRDIKIIPVLTVKSADEAVSTCKALQAGGITAVEITLRTDAALDSMRAIKSELPNFLVAAGTIKRPADMEDVAKIGVDFAVSPGLTPALSDCADALKMLFLPGVATASELMQGLATGRRCFKLYPAEAVGGVALLKALAAPFPEASFCPTGGVGAANFTQYLALSNVACVGGSWMVSRELIEAKQWEEIAKLSREAMA
jgi:2-dehydro-3-deoxyphosphogluconate aldolase/(4S)-4-hydroxy-2-oxoglutarate aldolase